jgi:hypothetical protein
VVINVKGSRRSKDDDRAAIGSVLRYMMYISRNGRLLSSNERGDRIDGRDAISETHASWNLDMQRMRSGKNEQLHPAFNIIFSMPAATDPDKLLDAVAAVALQPFQGHQYLMALHTPETDPAEDAPPHPHVHLVLRAESESGHRMHIRKADLRKWREQFAAELRARGIEANATSRAERGKSLKPKSGAEWHIQKRYEANLQNGKSAEPPRAKVARFQQVAHDVQDGEIREKPWELAMAARRRDVLRGLSESVTRLRHEGENALADQVVRFIQELPPLDTERHQIERALVDQVKRRLHEYGHDKESDFIPK